MNTSYVHGYHGHGNFGDDLFAWVIANKLTESMSIDEILFSADLYGNLAALPHTRILNSRFPLITRIRRNQYLSKINGLILGGGSLLNSHSTDSVISGIAEICGNRDVCKMALSLGVGPFLDQSQEKRAAKLLADFSLIVTRDDHSFEWCKEMSMVTEVRNGFDMALLALDQVNRQTSPVELDGLSRIGISVVPNNLRSSLPASVKVSLDEVKRNYIAKVSDALNGKVDASCEYALFSLCRNSFQNDDSIMLMLKNSLRGVVRSFKYEGNVSDIVQEIASCTHFIAARLHAAISCYALGVPFLLLCYDQKSISFAHSIGLDERLVIDTRSGGMEEFESSLEYLLSLKAIPCGLTVSQMIDRAALNLFPPGRAAA